MQDIKKTVVFRNLTEAEQQSAMELLQVTERTFEKGAFLLSAGQENVPLGFIMEGGADIQLNDEWGNRTILSHVESGQFFAETYAMLPETILPVDVMATEPCRVLFLDTKALLDNSAEHPILQRIRQNLLQIALRKNLNLSERIFHTAPKTIRGKVLAYLTTEKRKSKTEIFDIPFDRQQLADYLNLDRTALSKELSKMKADGLIDFQKNHFKLL